MEEQYTTRGQTLVLDENIIRNDEHRPIVIQVRSGGRQRRGWQQPNSYGRYGWQQNQYRYRWIDRDSIYVPQWFHNWWRRLWNKVVLVLVTAIVSHFVGPVALAFLRALVQS